MHIVKMYKNIGFFGHSVNEIDYKKIKIVSSDSPELQDLIDKNHRKKAKEVHIESIENFSSDELKVLSDYLDKNYSNIELVYFYEKNKLVQKNFQFHIKRKQQREILATMDVSELDRAILITCYNDIYLTRLLNDEEKIQRMESILSELSSSSKSISDIKQSHWFEFTKSDYLIGFLGTVGTGACFYNNLGLKDKDSSLSFIINLICSLSSFKTSYNLALLDMPKNEAAGGMLALIFFIGIGGLALIKEIIFEPTYTCTAN